MSIKDEIKSGVIITFIARYSNVLIQLIIGIILARLLSPEEFGIVAIIMVFITFFNLLADMGIGPAIIQNKDLKKKDDSILFNFTILLGAILAVSFYFFSFLIAEFYSNNEYIRVGKFLSFSVFFFSLNIVPQSLIRKNKRFKVLGVIQVSVNVIVGIVAVTLAYLGYSYYSLVWQAILRSFFLFIFYYKVSGLKLTFSFSLSPIKRVFEFSIYQFLFNFINYFSRNLDDLLIGKFLGTTALGYYDRAYKLMRYPIQNLTHIITPVLHPILSNYQNEKESIYKTNRQLINLLIYISVPASILLFFSAEPIILLLYGKQWVGSIPIFKILSITIVIQIVLSSSGAIFQSTGKPNLMFLSGLLSAMAIILGIIYGIFYKDDIHSVAIGLLVAFFINFFQCYWLMYKFVFQKSYIEFMKLLIKPLINGFIIITGYLLLDLNLNNILIQLMYNSLIVIILLILASILTKDETYLLIKKELKTQFYNTLNK